MTSPPQFLVGQLSTPPEPKADLTNKTILVTGANRSVSVRIQIVGSMLMATFSGLGLDAAKLLVRLKCSTIVLTCRSPEKCEQARKDVLASVPATMQSKPQVVGLPLDLGSFQSVIECAQKCKSFPRLDAAILNAGVDLDEFSVTEGFETTITVNVISTFLFASLLLPTLRDTARRHNVVPNIAVVGSMVHALANPKDLSSPPEGKILSTLSDPKQAKMKERYFLSKLPVMLMVRHLSKMLEQSAAKDARGKPLVVINNVAPGLCKTNLFRNDQRFVTKAGLKMIGRSSEHGARTLVHGAVAGEETQGQYLTECQVKKASPFVNSAQGNATAERIWKELTEIYERVAPGSTSVW